MPFAGSGVRSVSASALRKSASPDWLPSAPKETDEIYFLSGGGENVKVRDDLMDIKVLRQVNADGLEQWAPVMKAEFPLSAADVATVVEAMRIPMPGTLANGCSLHVMLDILDRPDSGVRVVRSPQAPGPLHRRGLHG